MPPFRWGDILYAKARGSNTRLSRVSGKLVAPWTTPFTLFVKATYGVRLRIGHDIIVDAFGGTAPRTCSRGVLAARVISVALVVTF